MADDKEKSSSSKMVSYSTRPDRLPKIPKVDWANAAKAKRPNRAVAFGLAILIIFAFGFGGGWLGARTYNDHAIIDSSTSTQQRYVSDESQLIAQIAKNVGQSVVSIDVQTQVTSQDFFGFNQTQDEEAAGTGVIISSDGVIMTNRHVVPAGTTTVNVTLADGTQYKNVQVIGRTADTNPLDVAFLKIPNLNGKKLVPATLGDSSQVQVGDRIVAIGNALGQFQNTVTSGIISGYGRDLTAGDSSSGSDITGDTSDSENLTDLFQTDAAINEGNSGGPLVNINGQVIGLNTATAADAQNIGFSIPINDLKGLVNSVLKTGKLQQAYLGVRYVSITADIAEQYGLSVNNGAYVIGDGQGNPAVVAGSPADNAGVQAGDIISKVNGTSVDNKTSLTGALSQYQPGDKVTLTIIRNGKTITLDATLGNTPTN